MCAKKRKEEDCTENERIEERKNDRKKDAEREETSLLFVEPGGRCVCLYIVSVEEKEERRERIEKRRRMHIGTVEV